jgi:two-component system, sensor histidine kinase and response regulator
MEAGMNGCVRKPVKAGELFATIDRLRPADATVKLVPGASPVDLAAALRSVDGDMTILMEMIDLFRQDYPTHLAELRQAIMQGDASHLERSAHCLKGAMSVFGADTAYALAAELEVLGRTARLECASTVVDALDAELARLIAFFAASDWTGQSRL